MLNNIKEGGVSLTGQEQPFTHDHFRRSFIRRCKNPVINDKVHTLRALHSTLKVRGRWMPTGLMSNIMAFILIRCDLIFFLLFKWS